MSNGNKATALAKLLQTRTAMKKSTGVPSRKLLHKTAPDVYRRPR